MGNKTNHPLGPRKLVCKNGHDTSSGRNKANACKVCASSSQLRRTKERRKVDPLFKLANDLRHRTYMSLASMSWRKTSKFKDYIGCTLDELKAHLEKQFQPGMTWANQGEWHIDHIKPLATAASEKELYSLCHYSNLQPLWAIDNLRKGYSN